MMGNREMSISNDVPHVIFDQALSCLVNAGESLEVEQLSFILAVLRDTVTDDNTRTLLEELVNITWERKK